jgi:superfamily II DNA or RNA helicase
MVAVSQFQSKILRRQKTPEEYRVYRAGLEWDLTDPIVIESRDDLKSEYRWRDRLEPFHHQVTNLMTFCRRLPVTLLADDVGLGKTISAGLIISELIARSRLSKILVVCPKLLGPQWKEELETKFDIPGEVVIGSELLEAEPTDVGAIITTYASARMYLDRLPQDRFEMLILDEAHKLRNLHGVDPPPQVAVVFQKALQERRFRFVLMLTATPIQNRLWDLYSLVDLLTMASGHENPFGSPGTFARKFIADERKKARQLKLEARDQFRSIVYGYMSRIRRDDANLYFPDRKVHMHRVDPTAPELELIETIAKPIQTLNPLVQISILRALTSSPEALSAQLNNMARKGTVPAGLATAVKAVVARMRTTAKLDGLRALIEELKRKDPRAWRLVVCTGRLETQTTIEAFLSRHGFKVGIINGDSGARNQETLRRFRKDPPDVRVIVSTEAGSEGVNMQVANVLVNYDLPWNPMIVEQRIGRVQRLASEHASVAIFNMMLRGTFEEYIVGRLMEKLQMASHAIGDIEALLESSGIGDDDEDGFEEKIRELVVAALAGKNVEEATRKAEESIEKAKTKLADEKETVDALLGGMDGGGYVGPQSPSLPRAERSMAPREFTLAALESLGAKVTTLSTGIVLAEENGGKEYIHFQEEPPPGIRSIRYVPGTPPFARLVSRVIATGVHNVGDQDREPAKGAEVEARQWVESFGATSRGVEIDEVTRSFEGIALMRVRATVAHDSYERLVPVACSRADHRRTGRRDALASVPRVLEDPTTTGLSVDRLIEAAGADDAIAEFARFYLERREEEKRAAAGDERKRRKLEDEFTPRLEMTLVGLEGDVRRDMKVRARYSFDGEDQYASTITVTPSLSGRRDEPAVGLCTQTSRTVPRDSLQQCEATGSEVLRHLLVKSEISGRYALPEFTLTCGLSGKRILADESEVSDLSGVRVTRTLLKTSPISGKKGESQHFGRCSFSATEVLKEELAVSDISGRSYRSDQEERSAVTGKRGHRQEFIPCYEIRQPIAISEAETCEVTGQKVRPGILEACAVSGRQVLPSELETCAATGKRALKRFLVTSSITGARYSKKRRSARPPANIAHPAKPSVAPGVDARVIQRICGRASSLDCRSISNLRRATPLRGCIPSWSYSTACGTPPNGKSSGAISPRGWDRRRGAAAVGSRLRASPPTVDTLRCERKCEN